MSVSLGKPEVAKAQSLFARFVEEPKDLRENLRAHLQCLFSIKPAERVQTTSLLNYGVNRHNFLNDLNQLKQVIAYYEPRLNELTIEPVHDVLLQEKGIVQLELFAKTAAVAGSASLLTFEITYDYLSGNIHVK